MLECSFLKIANSYNLLCESLYQNGNEVFYFGNFIIIIRLWNYLIGYKNNYGGMKQWRKLF